MNEEIEAQIVDPAREEFQKGLYRLVFKLARDVGIETAFDIAHGELDLALNGVESDDLSDDSWLTEEAS